MAAPTFADMQAQRPVFRRPTRWEPGGEGNPAIYTVWSRRRPVGHVQRVRVHPLTLSVKWQAWVWPVKAKPYLIGEYPTRIAAGWAIVNRAEGRAT